MLFRELLSLIPDKTSDAAIAIALAGAAIGAAFWLMGARFSRHLVALLCCGVGALLGMRAPAMYGWNISGAGVAVAGAIAAGVTGFILHRLLIGVLLGGVLSSWTAIGTWILFRNGQSWSMPVIDPTTTIASFAQDLWRVLPPDVTRLLPWSAGIAMLSGIAMTIAWPKLAVALNWSVIGVTLLVSMGLAAVQYCEPKWLGALPGQTWAQLIILGGITAFGVVMQWRLAPKTPKANSKPPSAPAGAAATA